MGAAKELRPAAFEQACFASLDASCQAEAPKLVAQGKGLPRCLFKAAFHPRIGCSQKRTASHALQCGNLACGGLANTKAKSGIARNGSADSTSQNTRLVLLSIG